MPRPLSTDKRRTPRCDANGNLLEQYRMYAPRLAKALRAGVPADLLDQRGWTGDPNDTTGLFADLIYDLGELPLKGPVNPMTDAEEIIAKMVNVCNAVGADWREAIEFPTFLRLIRETRERNARLERGEEVPWDEANNCFKADGTAIW